jgi:hypothetical protein
LETLDPQTTTAVAASAALLMVLAGMAKKQLVWKPRRAIVRLRIFRRR